MKARELDRIVEKEAQYVSTQSGLWLYKTNNHYKYIIHADICIHIFYMHLHTYVWVTCGVFDLEVWINTIVIMRILEWINWVFLKLITAQVYIYFNCVVISQKTLLLVPWAKARTQYYWDAKSLNTTVRYTHTTPRQRRNSVGRLRGLHLPVKLVP